MLIDVKPHINERPMWQINLVVIFDSALKDERERATCDCEEITLTIYEEEHSRSKSEESRPDCSRIHCLDP